MFPSELLYLILLLQPMPPDTSYRQYEKENVGFYRKKIEWTPPKVTVTEAPPVIYRTTFEDPSDTVRATWQIPSALEKLLEIHRPKGEVKIDGFRVQIYAGTDMDAANKIKAKFVQQVADVDVYVTWESPHFRVRTGNFLSRNDALNFSNRIKEHFPGAFVVPDKVKVK